MEVKHKVIPGLRHKTIKYTARRDRESEQLFVSLHKERSKTSIKKLERNATRNSMCEFSHRVEICGS